ncbi:uncharacterized protein [Phaseolus vulgaris]|uniref:uncharacterized protein n=1 Tax=Phaseolus vulgaris TaxID=3885 RepID=UPI0035CC93EE
MAEERIDASSQADPANNYLYLHPSENPAAPLVSPVLDASNYHSWSRLILTTLNAKNKVEFVLGTHPYPVKDHQNFPIWNKCNNMVVSWLVHSVSLPIQQSIIWMDSALDIWNDLKTRYSQGDLSRISDLQLEVASLNQGNLSVTEYFTKLRIIWDELNNFRPIPDILIYYCTFCGKHGHTENVYFRKVGFPNQDNRNSKYNTRKVCTYCNRNGHTVDTCYKKHGYPSGYKSYNSNRTNQINSLITTDGVFSEPCPKEQEKRDYQLTAHQIQIINDVLRQNNNDTPPNPIQVNQVGSFSTDPNAHELSSTDIWGLCSTTSMQGFRYFLTIVDDFSRYT